MFSALADFANRSSIYKRHEARSSLNHGNEAQQPIHAPHVPTDQSMSETFSKLMRRSTIYNKHEVDHQELKHDPHAGERHMPVIGPNQDNGMLGTLQRLNTKSSIYDRNSRRNQFLHDA